MTQITVWRAGFRTLSPLIPVVLRVWDLAQTTPVKAADLQALCSSCERWHVLKVAPWGIAKVTEVGIQKACSCHYRFVGNIICCHVNISYSFVGTVKKWSVDYQVLFSAMNAGLKVHPDSLFSSKLFGYILQIFMQLSPMKSVELYQLCTL